MSVCLTSLPLAMPQDQFSQLVDVLRESTMMDHALFAELTKFKIQPIQEDVCHQSAQDNCKLDFHSIHIIVVDVKPVTNFTTRFLTKTRVLVLLTIPNSIITLKAITTPTEMLTEM